MTRRGTAVVLGVALGLATTGGTGFARGFGGGFRGGGGFRSEGFRGEGFRGEYGGYRGYGGYQRGYAGMPTLGRPPSFYAPGPLGRPETLNLGGARGAEGRGTFDRMPGERIEYGTRPRSYAAAGRRAVDTAALRPYRFDAYREEHAGWVHGTWDRRDSAAWGWRDPFWGAYGLGLGWGLAAWGYGSDLYGMGYLPYGNPYVDNAAAPYDYSQPIDTTSPPAAETVVSPALALFDAGRASFRQGDAAAALRQADEALAKLPGDTTLHEFRALCLFALGRYDEAAAALYAVLSVGPGWDWTTLVGLYPSVATYTGQLRALEQYCSGNPGSAAGRFVLAYQYLSQGHTDAAVSVLKQVVSLKPGDALSAKLLRQLDPARDAAAVATAAATASPAPPTSPAPPRGASIAGRWTARPATGTTITLEIAPAGAFTWAVEQNGTRRQYSGTSAFGDGLLTLARDGGPALVGRVAWADPDHLTFRVVGDGPGDPGLRFSK